MPGHRSVQFGVGALRTVIKSSEVRRGVHGPRRPVCECFAEGVIHSLFQRCPALSDTAANQVIAGVRIIYVGGNQTPEGLERPVEENDTVRIDRRFPAAFSLSMSATSSISGSFGNRPISWKVSVRINCA